MIKDFVAHIPAGLKNRQELFKTLAEKLNFPNYFGYNWDALDECLQDLSWIIEERVILIHDDIPGLEEKEIGEYLDILKTNVEYWKKVGQEKLQVVLP